MQTLPFSELSPEEQIRHMKELREQEACRLYGSADDRRQKNREHVESMITEFSEPVIRQILKTLAGIYEPEQPVFAKILSRQNLDHADLNSFIRLYDLEGPRIKISRQRDNEWSVFVSGGYGSAQEHWHVEVWRLGTRWSVKRCSGTVT